KVGGGKQDNPGTPAGVAEDPKWPSLIPGETVQIPETPEIGGAGGLMGDIGAMAKGFVEGELINQLDNLPNVLSTVAYAAIIKQNVGLAVLGEMGAVAAAPVALAAVGAVGAGVAAVTGTMGQALGETAASTATQVAQNATQDVLQGDGIKGAAQNALAD